MNIKSLGIVTVLAVAACGHPAPAPAQVLPPTCSTRAGIDQVLVGRFAEHRVMWMTNERSAYSFYANPDTMTWTLVVETAGVACMLAAGRGFGLYPDVGAVADPS